MIRLKKTVRFLRSVILIFTGAAVATLAFLWIAAGEIYDYDDSFSFERDSNDVDVILVLAGGKGRIETAAELWQKISQRRMEKKLKPCFLFFSGVGPRVDLAALTDKAKTSAALKQLNRDFIIFEDVSENTFENAQIFSAFARQNHWKHIVVVTAGYHMRRAYFILEKALDPQVKISTQTVDAIHFDRYRWHDDLYSIRVTLIEYIKWLYYRYSYR